MRICEHCVADLKRIRNPLLIFASSGDNITPPHQALNWIPVVYPTTKKLKEAGQRIVYLLNTHVGHLGIFVSTDVARFEHRAILENLNALEELPPGLHEMKIATPPADVNDQDRPYAVAFEERRVEDIRFEYPRRELEKVQQVSEFNESLYAALVSPWVRAMANPFSATMFKWFHPMRVSRYAFSEKFAPWIALFEPMAHAVREHRQQCDEDNPLRALEHEMSEQVTAALESYRKARDLGYELMFQALYGG